ncbi:MAG: hypothetical protein QXF24_02350 [Thermoproteota archaeon]
MKRSEAFALAWFAAFPLFVFFDGNIVECLGLYPCMAWDTALKYYYIGLSSVEAFAILLLGFVFSRKEDERPAEARRTQPSRQRRTRQSHC